jgi:hypothetical protein
MVIYYHDNIKHFDDEGDESLQKVADYPMLQ